MIEHLAVLRPWQPDDAEWYVAQLSDPEILRFTTESADTTVDQFHDALTKLAAAPGQVGFAIIDPESESLAGNIAAAIDEADQTTAKISYWLAAEARGQGLATRAVQELCSWIRGSWPQVERVALWTHVDNVASQRVALAAGFHRQLPKTDIEQSPDSDGQATGTHSNCVSARLG